jgi:predicted acyl esterase
MTQAIRDDFIFIPLGHGRRLAARLFRPDGVGRCPAILDFSPYRCFDLFRSPTEMTLPVWAAAGYATLAIDIAGAGGSTGVLRDEYLPGEIDDACAAIAWCAEQDWCDGNVGLSGLSWAAFAALRVAARKPPALKALVLGGVSEDGWRTDIHYLGGVPYTAQVDWAGVMLMFNALPPGPLQAGETWRAQWLERLEANEPWIIPWLTHPTHDAYWTDKAARTDGELPLLLYSGFADKYAASVLRIAEDWKGPVRTIIGPWEHTMPHVATREPRIGFPQLALDWWDRHLKGSDAPDIAPLTLWTGERWCAVEQTLPMTLALNGSTLTDMPDDRWHRLPDRSGLPAKLRSDLYEDAPAPFDAADLLTAASDAMTEDREIGPSSLLRCEVRGAGHLIARLLDRAPDGTTTRMTTGALNVTTAGTITLPFQASAWTLKAGHQLVLALSADGWPTFWPRPSTLELRDVRLELPLISGPDTTFPAPVVPLGPAMGKPRWLKAEPVGLPTDPDAAMHETSTAYHLEPTGTDYGIAARFEAKRLPSDQAWAAKSYRVAFERPGWSIRIDTRLEVRSTPDAYQVSWALAAAEDGHEVHKSERKTTVKRNSG